MLFLHLISPFAINALALQYVRDFPGLSVKTCSYWVELVMAFGRLADMSCITFSVVSFRAIFFIIASYLGRCSTLCIEKIRAN